MYPHLCACVTKYLFKWDWMSLRVRCRCVHQFVLITQWKLLWMIFTSLINICSEKRNTTNDGNGTCTHVINAFYTSNMTFSNKISWTKLNLIFTTTFKIKTFLDYISRSYPFTNYFFIFKMVHSTMLNHFMVIRNISIVLLCNVL